MIYLEDQITHLRKHEISIPFEIFDVLFRIRVIKRVPYDEERAYLQILVDGVNAIKGFDQCDFNFFIETIQDSKEELRDLWKKYTKEVLLEDIKQMSDLTKILRVSSKDALEIIVLDTWDAVVESELLYYPEYYKLYKAINREEEELYYLFLSSEWNVQDRETIMLYEKKFEVEEIKDCYKELEIYF